ncbi:Imm1 family immunity protein [Saccharothrix xinjiangensis]|uniref:Imm1 family immunity protein n=1 Tax=Saccharothrix xinjiangensis TaxID=204798 RepID=A0ABV9YCM8_9PSEU
MTCHLEVAYHHDRPVAELHSRDDIARFADELPTPGWEYTAATVYAVDAEVPLGAVREAMWQLLTTGGARPTCVTWQEDRR